MTIAIDGAVGAAPTGSFGTVTLTTTSTNELIVFIIYNESPTLRTVSSVSGASLTFTKQAAYSGADPGRGGNNASLELWTAPSTGTLTGATFTITMSGTFDDGGVIAFGVSGLADITSPFDSNANAIKTGTGGTETISTTQANDIIIAAYASSFNNNPGNQPPSGFTNVDFANTGGGTFFSSTGVASKIVSTTQSSVSITTGSGSPTGLADLVFALTGDTKAVTYDLSVEESGLAVDQNVAFRPGSLTVEQYGYGFINPGATSQGMSLTTLNTNDLIVLVYSVAGEGSDGPAISSISSPTGLSTWTQRKTFYSSDEDIHTEVWWATAASKIDGQVFTVTFASAIPSRGATLMDFFVTGANIAAPFDPNASLPAVSAGTSGTQSLTGLSTTDSNDLVFTYLSAIPPNTQIDTLPSGAGAVLDMFAANTDSDTNSTSIATGLGVKAISVPLSSATETWGASGNGVMYFDAITADDTHYTASITETMTAADLVAIPINLIVNEAMHATDTSTRSAIFTASVAETGHATDTPVSGIHLRVAEILSATDTAGDSVEAPGGIFLLNLRDILTATDTASSESHLNASVAETMHVVDLTSAGINGVFSVSVIEAGHLVATQTEHMRTNSAVQDILAATDHVSGIVTTAGHAGIFNLAIHETGNLVDHIGEAQTFTTPGLYFWNYLYAYPGTMSCWIAGLDCGDWPIAPDGSVFVPWRSDPDGLYTPAWLINLANNPPENGFGPLACNVDLTTNTGTILRIVVSAAIGHTYTSRVQLLAPNSPELSHSQFGPSFGTTRRLHQYAARVVNAGQMKVGTDANHMLAVQFRQPNGAKYPASQLFTGTHWDQVDDDYSYEGELMVEIDRPYPATITALGGFMKTNDRD